MWIVILNFCLFILLIGFMFYGFSKWSKLISEYNDGSEENQNINEDAREDPQSVTDMKYYRLPLWILLLGIATSQFIGFIQYLLGC